MIVGIGNDIIENSRVLSAIKSEPFINKIFTEKEKKIAIQKSNFFLVSNFAVKEAFVKALGLGFRSIKPTDIEVFRDDLGKPYILLCNEALNIYESLKIQYIHVTISNCQEYTIATVILEK